LLVHRHVGGLELRGGTRRPALTLELRLETLTIDGHALVGGDLLDDLDRDSVGVVEAEDGLSGEAWLPALARPARRLAHAVDALRQSPREALLLRQEDLRDPLRDGVRVLRLDVDSAIDVDHRRRQPVEER